MNIYRGFYQSPRIIFSGIQDRVPYAYNNKSYNTFPPLLRSDVECYLCHNFGPFCMRL